MPRVSLPTGEVHYTEQGQGPALVLLHANPGDSRDFEAVVPALARHARVIALDWPGYGQSSLPDHPEARGAHFFDEVLHAFLAALALPQVTLIGNSLGGACRGQVGFGRAGEGAGTGAGVAWRLHGPQHGHKGILQASRQPSGPATATVGAALPAAAHGGHGRDAGARRDLAFQQAALVAQPGGLAQFCRA